MIIKGDINGDGRITKQDLILSKLHLLGARKMSGEPILDGNALLAADVNGDGEITLSDMALINFHCLGLGITNEVIY